MKKHRASPCFAPKRSTVAVALALCLGTLGTDAYAFGFGEPEVSSALGQPLQMRVALQPDPNVDLSPQCLHLLGSPRDPLPTLTAAKLTIEEQGTARYLRIESLNAIDEPILRVVVDAGCVQHVRREFTVLLDPPVALPSAPALASALAPPLAATLNAVSTTNVAPPDATISTELAASAALDLGVARIHGRIGEPLAMEIPITGSAAADVDNGSLRVTQVLNSDGSPLHHALQTSLTRSDARTLLQIVSADPIAEPALRVVVEVATAHASVRREYGVLLDLPAPPTKTAESAAAEAAAAAPAAPAAERGTDAKAATRDTPAEAAAPPVEAAVPGKAPKRKHVHRVLKPTTAPTLAEAPRNAPVPLANQPAHGAGQEPARADAPAATPKGTGTDHLQLSAPVDDAAVKRFAEMDRRVQDLTQEIVKLRGDLALQKQREAELVAEGARPGGSWIAAVFGAMAVVIGAFVLWTRRRAGAPAWNPASWESGTLSGAARETVGPGGTFDTRMSPGSANEAPAPAGDRPAAALAPAPGLPGRPGSRAAGRPANTVSGADPITISPLTTPIEVTEVLANEPSIEQLYTLFYDIGGNTTPGGKLGPGPNPSTVLPPVALPKTEQLDINLGIPESVQSARAARAQGAMKVSAALAGAPKGDVPPAPAFSYTGNALPGRTLDPGKLDVATNVGPMTEMPRDGDFPKTQPGLDLDLSTQPGLVTRFGPATELPHDDDAAPLAAATRPDGPAALDLDLSTSVGSTTQIGPLTELPRDDDEPKTQVALDLNLNTNVGTDGAADAAERESDPFAITTIPGTKN